MSAIRQYSKLPVWIVENHNEVLEPIYRAIATRHLPFEGIAMLHFDSHPDLQIDTHMSADIVFNKQELLDVLSIENWIMPAIYAGHIDHVTWVKPPWADQLPEGSRKIRVGGDRSSGKLRVNWPDSYFLSDLLYAPAEELENGKDAVVNVVTLETRCLRIKDFSPSPSVCLQSRCKASSTTENVKRMQDTSDAALKMQGRTFSESERSASNAERMLLERERCASTAVPGWNNVESSGDTQTADELPCVHPTTHRKQEEMGLSSAVKESRTSTSQIKSWVCTCTDEQDLIDGERTCPTQKPCRSMEQKDCHECSDNVANLKDSNCEGLVEKSGNVSLQCNSGGDMPQHKGLCMCSSLKCSSNAGITNFKSCNSVANLSNEDGCQQKQGSKAPLSATNNGIVQAFSEFNGRFILDIDLDFFSTRNPFKQMYTKEQYSLMDGLYQFAAPVDDSPQALKACQERRAKQISELSTGLKAAFNGEEYGASLGEKERFLKVVELVESLKSTPDIGDECLDPEMVHMAGLTCDDHGELPHHVSSNEEIDSLISAMEELLGKMALPTMVTISRSSHDDYCPAQQVDGIQHKVLKMLQSLYNKLDIHLEYEAT